MHRPFTCWKALPVFLSPCFVSVISVDLDGSDFKVCNDESLSAPLIKRLLEGICGLVGKVAGKARGRATDDMAWEDRETAAPDWPATHTVGRKKYHNHFVQRAGRGQSLERDGESRVGRVGVRESIGFLLAVSETESKRHGCHRCAVPWGEGRQA